ncbi:glutamine synthetase family protein [Oceanomicrobium pacificus]|uniref:Glutamine synthetase n=1 Tax=Oceanomicrobium pacificus TaxID=2692916 RepID=A0A6B0U770_9RHOB|nr:glutamine synthetase family protein [Oceanomicrobium pacificus]MXU66711.1 glutamine synthetase [Oceanomicrobium pacificus]
MADFDTEYAAYVAEHGEPDRLELMLCDTNAILRGKWLPGGSADKLSGGSVRLPLSTYVLNINGEEVEETGFGIAVGDPDGEVTPLSGTLAPVPWADVHAAQVMVSLKEDTGEISAIDSRRILERTVERFTALGLTPVVATELEFYLTQARETADEAPVPPEHTPVAQAYDLDVCSWSEAFLQEVLDGCAAQGLPADTLIAEYGPGQFEINFLHQADAVRAADIAVQFRRLVRAVADKQGMEATFMAKPYAAEPGNSMHVHVSLVDADGTNLMAGDVEGELSPLLRQCVGGLLGSMKDLQAIFAPHMNSYRRFQMNSFAPVAANWGLDHRGAAVRIPATVGPAARLEHRISGADVNPYLALAALLGGMLDGIERDAQVPAPLDEENGPDLAENRLHANWDQAVDAFEAAPIAERIFGVDFVDAYCALRRQEISTLATQITLAEYQSYLGRL